MGLRSAGRVVLVNLLLLPALPAAARDRDRHRRSAFFVVNGWLLGRDLGDMVAARHLIAAATARLAQRDRRRAVSLLGLGGTALFLVPVVNLLAPVLGAAMATHLFHRSRA